MTTIQATDPDTHPSDHDPLFAEVLHAASIAKSAGNFSAHLVLDALVRAMSQGKEGELAVAVERGWVGHEVRSPSTPLTCDRCGATEGVSIEPSMTAYPWDGTGLDPNRDRPMCGDCGKAYHDYWEERWTD